MPQLAVGVGPRGHEDRGTSPSSALQVLCPSSLQGWCEGFLSRPDFMEITPVGSLAEQGGSSMPSLSFPLSTYATPRFLGPTPCPSVPSHGHPH